MLKVREKDLAGQRLARRSHKELNHHL